MSEKVRAIVVVDRKEGPLAGYMEKESSAACCGPTLQGESVINPGQQLEAWIVVDAP